MKRKGLIAVAVFLGTLGAGGAGYWHYLHQRFEQQLNETRTDSCNLIDKIDADPMAYDLAEDRYSQSLAKLGRVEYTQNQYADGVTLDFNLDALHTCRKLWTLMAPDFNKCVADVRKSSSKAFDDLSAQ